MNMSIVTLFCCLAAIVMPVHAEDVHLICTGKKLVMTDDDPTWSNEIIVDLETAEVIKFETTWKLAAKSTDYSFEVSAEIDASTIKIYDRVVGKDGEWEKVIVISRVDGTVEAIVTKTGTVSIRGKCTPAVDRPF